MLLFLLYFCSWLVFSLDRSSRASSLFMFFFNDTATTEIYTYLHTLSLHDALPISLRMADAIARAGGVPIRGAGLATTMFARPRSEEHTSELQSLMRISYAVFCLKKKNKSKKKHKQRLTDWNLHHKSSTPR